MRREHFTPYCASSCLMLSFTAGPLVVYWLGAQYSNNKFAEYLVAQESVVGYELREVYVVALE